MAGHLVLEAGHALVEVAGRPVGALAGGLGVVPIGAGEGTHQQPRLAGHGVPAARLVGLAVGAHVGREVVFPQRPQGLAGLLAGDDAAQSDLVGPALPEDLVDLAALVPELMASGAGGRAD